MRRIAAAFVMSLAAAAAHAETGQSGAWTYNVEPSSTGKGGIATALSPAPSPSGDPNDPTHLVVRCLGGRTELLVGGAGGWGLPRRQLQVTTRIDDAEPQTRGWDVSTNGKAVFMDDGVEAFLKSLPGDGKLVVSVVDSTGGRHETVFRTSGIGVVREKIAEACGWAP